MNDDEREEIIRVNHKTRADPGVCEVCFLLRRLDEAREALKRIVECGYGSDGRVRAIAVEALKGT